MRTFWDGPPYIGRSDGQITSLVEDLAGQVVDGSATDYEKSVLGGREKNQDVA